MATTKNKMHAISARSAAGSRMRASQQVQTTAESVNETEPDVPRAAATASTLDLLKMSNETMASELSTIMDDYYMALQRVEQAEISLSIEQQENAKLRKINGELSCENDEVVEDVQEMLEELQDLYTQMHTLTEEKLGCERLNEEIAMERDELADRLLEESEQNVALCPEEFAQEMERVRQTERAAVHAIVAEKSDLVQHIQQLTKQNDDMQAELDHVRKQRKLRLEQEQEGSGSSINFARDLRKSSRNGDASWSFLGASNKSNGNGNGNIFDPKNRAKAFKLQKHGSIEEEHSSFKANKESRRSGEYRRQTVNMISSAVSTSMAMSMTTSKSTKTTPTASTADVDTPLERTQGKHQRHSSTPSASEPHGHRSHRGSLAFVDQAMGFFIHPSEQQTQTEPAEVDTSKVIVDFNGAIVRQNKNADKMRIGARKLQEDLLCSFGRISIGNDGED